MFENEKKSPKKSLIIVKKDSEDKPWLSHE